jgi:hypothetical protein
MAGSFLNNLVSGKLNPNYQAPKSSAPSGGLSQAFKDAIAYGQRPNNPNKSTGVIDPAILARYSGGGGGAAPANNGPHTNAATISPNGAAAAAPSPYKDRSNDIAVNNAGLGTVDSQTNAGIAAIDKALGSLFGGYDSERDANEKNYQNESDSNQNSLQGGKQTALVHAGQGRQGLLGTLSSLGALSGDSIELANRAVQNGANEDLAGVHHTFATNQTGLDTSIGTFRREDKTRRDEAGVQADNAKTNARNQGLQTKQSFLTKLQNDYSDQGDEGTAKTYADQVAALYPQIAATNVPNANLVAQTAAYTPATLSSYLNNPNTAVTSTSGQGNSPGSLPTLSAINPLRKQTSPVAA